METTGPRLEEENNPLVVGCWKCNLFGRVTMLGDARVRVCPAHWAELFYSKLLKHREAKYHA